jgi:hypothetical protein
MVVEAFRRQGHDVDVFGHYYKSDEPLPGSITAGKVRRNLYDLSLYMEMNDDDKPYLNIKQANAKVKAYWDFDVSYHPEATNIFCKHMTFDHIFCANVDFVEFFGHLAPKVSVLPYAYCPEKHIVEPYISLKERKYKFAIIGSPWQERIDIIEAMKEAGLDAHLITDKFREDYIRALGDVQVSINCNVAKGMGLLVMRVWESLGCGCCLLTNEDDYSERFLTLGKDHLVYKSIPDLIKICKDLEKNPRLMNNIANYGRAVGRLSHTYDSRVNQILKETNLG